MSPHYLQQTIPQPQVHPARAVRTTLLENDEVLAIGTTYPPGESVPVHTHRFPSLVYVVQGGTIETMAPDGTVERYDMRPGETLWSAGSQSHGARNVGSTPVQIVEIEIKHATPAASASHKALRVVTPASLEWRPDSVDPRRAAALLVGDPTRPGPYVVRYRAPAGYEITLHMHPDDDEQLTVLSGAIQFSAGSARSGAPEHTLTAGGFVLTPAGIPHRLLAVEDSILQMSGIGPHKYVYVSGSAHRA